jgi:predicted outer membrane repeat protein
VRNNSATSGSGGGMCAGSLSTLVRTTFQENSSTANGGAIYNGSGQIDLQDGAIIDNTAYQGGGIYIDTEPAKLTQTGATLFSGNITDSHGGALYLDEGDATLDGANFTGNHAYRGGAAWVETEDSLLTLTNVRIEGNTVDEDGAGIYVNNGTAELARSAVIGNLANNIGSGLYNGYGIIRLTNVTVSGNDAQVNTSVGGGGGGIFLGGSSIWASKTYLDFVTLTQNTARMGAGGIEEALGDAYVQNSIIADNGDLNCNGEIISEGYNIDSEDSCNLNATGDLVNTDPALSPLAADGTHPLQSTSPAIDQGLCIVGITTDQRGIPRPQGAGCDIGAYELAPVALSGVSISGPASGVTGEDYIFAASVTPTDATGPITYTWSPVPQSGQGTQTATYQWDTAGNYNITVTATNSTGEATSAPHAITISEPPPVALIGVSIAGPTHGGVGIDYTFTATVAPNNASTPITYTWTPTPLGGQGTQSATYQWAAPGDYSITVTAENSVGQITSDPHNITITLEAPSYPVYLPLTLRP